MCHILHAELCSFLLSCDIQAVFTSQYGYSNTRTSLCVLDKTGNCQTLNRQTRGVPLGKGIKSVGTPSTPLHPLCVTEYMCAHMCRHPGVYNIVFEHVRIGPGGCWCGARRWGFVTPRSRSLVLHEATVVSLESQPKVEPVAKRGTGAWTASGP